MPRFSLHAGRTLGTAENLEVAPFHALTEQACSLDPDTESFQVAMLRSQVCFAFRGDAGNVCN